MAFTVFKKQNSGLPQNRPAAPGITMRRGAKNAMRIAINKPLAKELNWLKGDHVEVLVGSGPDAGFIALRRSPSGYRLSATSGSKQLVVNVRHIIPGPEVGSAACTFTREGNGVVIAVPPAFLSTLGLQQATLHNWAASDFRNINATVAA